MQVGRAKVRLKRVATLGVVALCVGCASGGAAIVAQGSPLSTAMGSVARPASGPSAGGPTEQAAPAASSHVPAPVGQTAASRREIAAAKTRRDQCLRLGSVIELVQPTEALVVEGNSSELVRMADALEHAAAELERVPLESQGIAALRTELTAHWRQMASALAESAAEDASERKRALARFREREAGVPKLFTDLSDLCNRSER